MSVPVSDLQAIAPSSIIELFELQLNITQHGVSATYRFHAGSSLASNGEVVWNGNAYLRYPIQAEGFEYSGKGSLPRPRIRCSNILSTITAIIATLPSGLEGAKLTRIRTLARYIDAVNFPGSVNPYGPPDPTAEFPREIYYVDRKVVETRDVVEFELAAAFDLAGVRAPKRQCLSNMCQWVYRSVECSYSGPPIADANDDLLPGVTSSPEAIAYNNAKAAFQATVAPFNAATTALNTARNNLNAAQGAWYKAETRYQTGSKVVAVYGVVTAYWDNAVVPLDTTYRRGAVKVVSYTSGEWEIERWALDNSAVTAAQSAYNTALSNYNAAKSTYDAALAARDAAFATWQSSPPYTNDLDASGDVCGKRLDSCKLRFGNTAQLPFGSFPGIGTYFT